MDQTLIIFCQNQCCINAWCWYITNLINNVTLIRNYNKNINQNVLNGLVFSIPNTIQILNRKPLTLFSFLYKDKDDVLLGHKFHSHTRIRIRIRIGIRISLLRLFKIRRKHIGAWMGRAWGRGDRVIGDKIRVGRSREETRLMKEQLVGPTTINM